jgi:hypothetical protein
MQQSITETDIERFKELLTGEHNIFKRLFNTDELRIESGIISIWDLDSKNWFYLKNNFEWTDDSENEDILKLISSDSQAE